MAHIEPTSPYVMTATRLQMYGQEYCADCGLPILAGDLAQDFDEDDGSIISMHDECAMREPESD